MKEMVSALWRPLRAAAVLAAVAAALLWTTVAHAQQSSDAQYGSPTGTAGPTGGALPATGGLELLLPLVGVLVLAAAGLMIFLRRRAAHR